MSIFHFLCVIFKKKSFIYIYMCVCVCHLIIIDVTMYYVTCFVSCYVVGNSPLGVVPNYQYSKHVEMSKWVQNVDGHTIRHFSIWKRCMVQPTTFPRRFSPYNSRFRGLFLVCGFVQAAKRGMRPLGGNKSPHQPLINILKLSKYHHHFTHSSN
jgi:hypothetical protein